MIEELQVINHWLTNKDPYYFRKLGIDKSYFVVLRSTVEYIEKFREQTGKVPTKELVATEFEDFQILRDLDPEEYLVGTLREQKAYMEFRPLYVDVGTGLDDGGNTIEQMWKMRNELDKMLTSYSSATVAAYDWVKHANERFERYMKNHGKTGLAGFSYGIESLDSITGGIRGDDNILLVGRMSEGKSLLGLYFAFSVWKALQKAGLTDPVYYVSTEMPEDALSYRLDTLRGHFSNRGLGEGKLEDPELYREYLNELSKKDGSFKILTTESFGDRSIAVDDLRMVAESEKPAFMAIDQLYDVVDGTGEKDIRKRIVNVSSGIRDFNNRTKTPVMLLAQAGRGAAKEARKNTQATPELDDIQESDNPAQKATHVITIRKTENTFKMTLKKNRSGERDKNVYMRGDIDRGIYEEIDEDSLYF